ncbi:MAG: hypothetical protein PVH18_00045 [Chloroflexota bacterium]|jgi:hypothetical protein
MSHHSGYDPYIERNAGDLITSEDWNEVQQFVKADIAANAAADEENMASIQEQLGNVDAARFGGQTPEERTEDNDKRYVKRSDATAVGEYRRYFKQLDKEIVVGNERIIEPSVIEHNLCRYPLVQVYELAQLFDRAPEGEHPFVWNEVKFLVYYASKRDPVAELLQTESSDWYYWGDRLPFILDQFDVQPARSQAFDDLLNDLWGAMFNPGLEQDQFKRDSYGHTSYVDKWIQDDKTVGELLDEGRYEDLRVAIRPQQLSAGMIPSKTENGINWWNDDELDVFHLSENTIEIRVHRAIDLMVLLRT